LIQLASFSIARFILVRAGKANAAITLATDGEEEAQGIIIRKAQTQLVAALLNEARANFIRKDNASHSLFQTIRTHDLSASD
jgi:hypothetical protein